MVNDTGTVGLLPMLAGLMVAGLTTATGGVVAGALAHGRVQAAADMVALAAASHLLEDRDPCVHAAEVAGANSARLVRCSLSGMSVTVTVSQELPPLLHRVLPEHWAEGVARAELRHSSSS